MRPRNSSARWIVILRVETRCYPTAGGINKTNGVMGDGVRDKVGGNSPRELADERVTRSSWGGGYASVVWSSGHEGRGYEATNVEVGCRTCGKGGWSVGNQCDR